MKFVFRALVVVLAVYINPSAQAAEATEERVAASSEIASYGFPAIDWLDPSVDPGTDFFAYANGGWLKHNPIPAAYSDWSVDREMALKNDEFIHDLLEAASRDESAAAGSDERKIGDFYFSGMDEVAIELAGAQALAPELQRIECLSDRREIPALLAHLHLIGVNAVFSFGQGQDYRDSSQVIAIASQGGLGLPSRDYYLGDDAKFKTVRAEYRAHIARMFVLLGESKALAERDAEHVLAIETTLAKASMPEAEQRNPHAVYHPMGMARLKVAMPGFAWDEYFAELGCGPLRSTNLMMPGFFRQAALALRKLPLPDWKAYLRWQTLHAFADTLSEPFVQESFRLERILSGAKELKPRWQRVAERADPALGFAIGRIYVERKFSAADKRAAEDMVSHIRDALHDTLAEASWLSPGTRRRALDKLEQLELRIGYPEAWRDYSALAIDRGPFVLNVIRANRFVLQRELEKIGKPVDRNDWDMTPQTVNAYYDASLNSINVPAAQLQPPYFRPDATQAANYGAIGSVIGHELTHGFDDEGSQFDGHGNMIDWWEKPDRAAFKKRIDCIAAQFSRMSVDGGLHLQGKLVAGEAAADLGGVLLAYRAFHAAAKEEDAPLVDGLSSDQQFFVSYAQTWAGTERPEMLRQMAVSDPHPPALYRVNGALANVPAFRAAFAIAGDRPMVGGTSCAIW
jgi:putative endopeptidase